ncbi:MAG TPA: RDD family protein, partial [Gammaproteobacteria bacterium]|nr:RDD family protein [Gammaproteobacteria bacterium]
MNSDCRRHAGLLRRLGAMLYDGFLLAGVMIVAAIPLPFFQSAADASAGVRALIQIYLVVVCFLFFGWFWTHGGQTLGMRAWRLQLYRIDGQNLAWSTAVVRFLSAL